MPYLQFSVNSALLSAFDDCEVIVSVDKSEKSATDFLQSIRDPRLRVVHPPEGLSMGEHWDWAQTNATGNWQIFLGQDDGLQRHFFDLAEILTAAAEANGVRSICSTRAYIHWPGAATEPARQGKVERVVRNKVQLRYTKNDALRALLGSISYFQLPHMYTTSLFSRKILEEARMIQGGRLIIAHPQDASLATLPVMLDRSYLKSWVPLGWVGSSPKSAGAAISRSSEKSYTATTQDLANSYLKSIASSSYQYPEWAGAFSLGNTRIYFWQAMKVAQHFHSNRSAKIFGSRQLELLLFGRSWADYWKKPTQRKRLAHTELREIASQAKVSPTLIVMISWVWVIGPVVLGSLFKSAKHVIKSHHLLRTVFPFGEIQQLKAAEPSEMPFRAGQAPGGEIDLSALAASLRRLRKKRSSHRYR